MTHFRNLNCRAAIPSTPHRRKKKNTKIFKSSLHPSPYDSKLVSQVIPLTTARPLKGPVKNFWTSTGACNLVNVTWTSWTRLPWIYPQTRGSPLSSVPKLLFPCCVSKGTTDSDNQPSTQNSAQTFCLVLVIPGCRSRLWTTNRPDVWRSGTTGSKDGRLNREKASGTELKLWRISVWQAKPIPGAST